MVWAHRIVIGKRIDPEIPSQITPDRVNVIRTILHVVVLDQKGWTMNAVIVRLA